MLKQRTLFDSLFLVFTMRPLLSNIFAVFAQFVEKEFGYAEVKIDKKAIVQEQTRLIKIEISKEKKRIMAVAEKKIEVEKVRQEKAMKIVKKLNKNKQR